MSYMMRAYGLSFKELDIKSEVLHYERENRAAKSLAESGELEKMINNE